MDFSMDKAKELLEQGMAEAQGLMKNASKVDDLLVQMEDVLRNVPEVGGTLSQVPLMISMVKCWGNPGFWVPQRMLLIMVGAMLYLVTKYYLMPDNIPVAGIADDLAVVGTALRIVKPELERYKKWRDG